jgi:hypothetical protein
MRDHNPTMPPRHVLRALPRRPERIRPRERYLSAEGMARNATEILARAAEEMASFPRGDHAPPEHILLALRQPRWVRERLMEQERRFSDFMSGDAAKVAALLAEAAQRRRQAKRRNVLYRTIPEARKPRSC